MAERQNNPLFTRSEKRRVRHKIKHKIKGTARKGFASLFGITLSPGLGGKRSRQTAHRSRPSNHSGSPASSSVRSDVISALRGQGYKRSQAESMTPRAESGEGFESLFRRSMRRNPGELIIFGNPCMGYTRKGIGKAYRQGNSIPSAIIEGLSIGTGLEIASKAFKSFDRKANPLPAALLQGLQFGAGETVVGDVLKKKKTARKRSARKHRRNPDSMDRATQLFQDFHHRAPAGTFETQRSAKLRKDFTILGPLVAIGINAEKYDRARRALARDWESYKVDHWDKLPHLAFLTDSQIAQVKEIIGQPEQYVKNCPQLASSPNGKQLYAITPDGANLSLGQFDTDVTKDFIDLGEATFVVYVAKKPDDAIEWVHELGEDGGTRPRLMYDRLKREIFFIGGSYTVEAPGILH